MHFVPLIISCIYTLQFTDKSKMVGIIDVLEGRAAAIQR